MCKQCETKPVYEFTNQRKLCKSCFIRWFQKKFLYTNRKFGLIKNGDIVGYVQGNGVRGAVLEDVLKMIGEKGFVEVVRLFPPTHPKLHSPKARDIDEKLLMENLSLSRLSAERLGEARCGAGINRAKRGEIKIAISDTTDVIAEEIINEIINGDIKKIKVLPVDGNVIRPLYLFLDKEVLLYAKLKGLFPPARMEKNKLNLKFFKDISKFINELEKKHPEVKRSVVNSYLELFG